MDNNKLTKQDLLNAVLQVSDGEAHALLQGYPMTCFARVTEKELELPPVPEWRVAEPAWHLFWDVRVFGSKGECHFWRDKRGRWKELFRSRTEGHAIERNFALWGTRAEKAEGDWTRCWEQNGAEIWAPPGINCSNPPLRLKVREIVGYQKDTGVAGIVDMMIVGF